MQAMDHHISALVQRTLRKIGVKPKMCPMRFVNNQGTAVPMDNLCNPLDIRNDPVIGGGGDQDCLDVGMLV